MKNKAIFFLGLLVIGFLSYKIIYKEISYPEDKFPNKSILDLEKKIKSRDLVGQFQKFNETFKIYQSWTPEQKQLYSEQHQISPEFIKATEEYFKTLESLGNTP